MRPHWRRRCSASSCSERKPALSRSTPSRTRRGASTGGSADSMQYSALAQDQPRQREAARAGVVLPRRRRSRQASLQPADRRRRDVRGRDEERRRRARRRDRQRALDVSGRSHRARPRLLGERRSLRPPVDPHDEQWPAGDRCKNRRGDRHVRHATAPSTCGREALAVSAGRTRVPDASSRISSSSDPTPVRDMDRRQATFARTTSSREPSSGRFTRSPGPANTGTRRGRRMPGSTPAARTSGETSRSTRRTASCFFRPARRRTISYGADRAGDNLFGNCLVALDARTGKRLWHFQVVHHDLWDYDLASAPKLLTVRHDGKPVDIVAQAGKTGFLYVFERLTGKPLWPIEERPVPKSEVPGEVSSPTQPIPVEAAAVCATGVQARGRQPVHESRGTGAAASRRSATPPMRACSRPRAIFGHHIQFPGAWGGANWGSTAADPATGMLFVRSLEMPSYRRMAVNTPSQAPAACAGRSARAAGIGESTHRSAPRVTARARRRCDRRPSSAPEQLQHAAAAGPGTDAGASRRRCCRRRAVDALEAYLAQPAARGRRARRERCASSAAESRRYSGPAVALRGLVLGRMVYEQRASRGRAAVDAARRLRPQRRHDQVARARRTRARPRRAGDHEHRHRAPEKRSGRHRGRPGVRRELAGPHAPRVRRERWPRAVGAGARGESRGDSGGLRSRRPPIHRLCRRRVVGFRNRPVWKNAFHRKQGKIEAQGYHVFALPQARAADRNYAFQARGTETRRIGDVTLGLVSPRWPEVRAAGATPADVRRLTTRLSPVSRCFSCLKDRRQLVGSAKDQRMIIDIVCRSSDRGAASAGTGAVGTDHHAEAGVRARARRAGTRHVAHAHAGRRRPPHEVEARDSRRRASRSSRPSSEPMPRWWTSSKAPTPRESARNSRRPSTPTSRPTRSPRFEAGWVPCGC